MNSRILYTSQESKRSSQMARKKIKAVLVVAVILALFGGMLFLLRWPYLEIKKIEISGLEIFEGREVETGLIESLQGNYAPLIPKNNFFLLDSAALALLVKNKFPRVESVSIQKSFPDSLKVYVKEREFWAIFCSTPVTNQNSANATTSIPAAAPSRKCVSIDKTGFAYEDAPHSSGSLILKVLSDLPEVSIGNYYLGADLIKEMSDLASKIKESAGVEISAFTVISKLPQEFRAKTNEGFAIWVKRGDDRSRIAKALKTILDQEVKDKRPQLEYIDLRFGNKVFYKVKAR